MKNESQYGLLLLQRYLYEHTDDQHPASVADILAFWQEHGIQAGRKSVYSAIEVLQSSGMDIVCVKSTQNRYFVGERLFELPELKLLVDAIQSSKFITEKKTNILIKKLEKLVSKYDAQKLQRQVYVSGRIKTMNESIYYTVDAIHNAISENKKIKFQYFQWNVKKEMELRHGGAWYHISPWGLSWDDENYYLIAYDSSEGIIKHFRVDKMLYIKSNGKGREGRQVFKSFDMAAYARKMFGMYGGKEEWVRIECDNSFAGVMIDRFGKDVSMIRLDDKRFVVNVEVAVSRQFLAWIISLGEGVTLV